MDREVSWTQSSTIIHEIKNNVKFSVKLKLQKINDLPVWMHKKKKFNQKEKHHTKTIAFSLYKTIPMTKRARPCVT